MFRVEGIKVHFGGVVAVDGISIAVHEQEVFGLIGPNGSGKTTLLNAITGVVPAQGRMTMADKEVPLQRPRSSRSSRILRVFQAPQTFNNLSCIENAMLACADGEFTGLLASWFARRRMWQHERERWRRGAAALERVGLGGLGDLPAGQLTYGQQRLLEIARAIAAEPRLLLLDEPSAGLNDVETRQLAELCLSLREDRLSVVVIDHKIDFINKICERVGVLEMGRLIATGIPSDVWKNPRVMDAYLGEAADA